MGNDGNNEVMEPMAPVALNDPRQGVDVFPDDDDMFPMGMVDLAIFALRRIIIICSLGNSR